MRLDAARMSALPLIRSWRDWPLSVETFGGVPHRWTALTTSHHGSQEKQKDENHANIVAWLIQPSPRTATPAAPRIRAGGSRLVRRGARRERKQGLMTLWFHVVGEVNGQRGATCTSSHALSQGKLQEAWAFCRGLVRWW